MRRRVSPLSLPRAVAALIPVALALGVLSMHSVSGGRHHEDRPMGVASETSPMAGAAIAMAVGVDTVIETARAPRGQPSQQWALAGVCAFVFLGGLVLAFRLVSRLVRRKIVRGRLVQPWSRERAPRGPPRDLLMVLCVMRT